MLPPTLPRTRGHGQVGVDGTGASRRRRSSTADEKDQDDVGDKHSLTCGE